MSTARVRAVLSANKSYGYGYGKLVPRDEDSLTFKLVIPHGKHSVTAEPVEQREVRSCAGRWKGERKKKLPRFRPGTVVLREIHHMPAPSIPIPGFDPEQRPELVRAKKRDTYAANQQQQAQAAARQRFGFRNNAGQQPRQSRDNFHHAGACSRKR